MSTVGLPSLQPLQGLVSIHTQCIGFNIHLHRFCTAISVQHHTATLITHQQWVFHRFSIWPVKRLILCVTAVRPAYRICCVSTPTACTALGCSYSVSSTVAHTALVRVRSSCSASTLATRTAHQFLLLTAYPHRKLVQHINSCC